MVTPERSAAFPPTFQKTLSFRTHCTRGSRCFLCISFIVLEVLLDFIFFVFNSCNLFSVYPEKDWLFRQFANFKLHKISFFFSKLKMLKKLMKHKSSQYIFNNSHIFFHNECTLTVIKVYKNWQTSGCQYLYMHKFYH